jgi:hypothetical protein
LAQPSAVQGLPSSQSAVSPAVHWPAWHFSRPLQGLPSLQGLLFAEGLLEHPDWGLHVSSVHELPSLHVSVALPLQAPS